MQLWHSHHKSSAKTTSADEAADQDPVKQVTVMEAFASHGCSAHNFSSTIWSCTCTTSELWLASISGEHNHRASRPAREAWTKDVNVAMSDKC